MFSAFDQLTQYFDERNVRYLLDEANRAIHVDLRGECAVYRLVVKVGVDNPVLHVFGHIPIVVEEGCRQAVAEVLTRANWGLNVGKFVLDFDHGELRFHAAQFLVDEHLDRAVVDCLFSGTAWALDAFVPAVLSVIYGNESPSDAIRHVEIRLGVGGEAEQAHRGADD